MVLSTKLAGALLSSILTNLALVSSTCIIPGISSAVPISVSCRVHNHGCLTGFPRVSVSLPGGAKLKYKEYLQISDEFPQPLTCSEFLEIPVKGIVPDGQDLQ